MTYAPATLRALAAFWTAQGGVNLGIVGDTSHQAIGTSYHLGKDQLVATAYSIKTARDKAGLTNGASAMDFGRLNGSLGQLRTFSKWLVDQARHNAPGTFDIREIIYTPDGTTVLRWDRERGYASAPRPGEADNSHLTHTHVSWYRDAELRDHTTAIRPYFTQETPMTALIVFAKPQVAAVPTGTWIYDNEACAASAGNIQVSPGRPMPVAGKLANGTIALGYVDTTPTESELREFFAKPGTVTLSPAVTPPPPDTTPYSQADLDASHASGVAEGASTASTTERERIADAEHDRIAAI